MRNFLILLAVLISTSGIAAPKPKAHVTHIARHIKYITVRGTVTDSATKTNLPGAAIFIRAKNLAQVDTNGSYKVVVPAASTLSFVCLGYTTQIIKLKPGQKILDVQLVAANQALSAIVIRGYVKRNRDETTGASYVVTSPVKNNPIGTVKQLLQGKSAKLNTKNNASGPVLRSKGNTTYYGYPTAPPGTESYNTINENPFLNPQETPLSTFATDVDAASYTNVRRFINNGQLPPRDAVRIEEMINYFKYNLPKPDHNEPVAIHTELATAPWNPKHQLIRIGLKAKEVDADKLPPSNLVFLIDVSGSMGEPNKLSLVKTSLKMLVDQLRPIDNVAIVTYAGYVSTPLESIPGDQKQKIKDAIDQLQANGSTAGAAGIMTAYKIAGEKYIDGGNNRIIMATDGDFNVGPSSDKDMEQIIEEESGTKVSLSIMGFGMGNYKDSKMELLADKGHGNYAYIDNITEASKALVNEFGGTLFTVAKDVKLQVEFNPARVQAYRLLGYEDRLMAKEDFNNDDKMGGDMGVGHTVTALYEIVPVGIKDDFVGSVDPLKYQKNVGPLEVNNADEVMTIKFRYKKPDKNRSKKESVTVKGEAIGFDQASDDFRFAASVAEFGLLLRNSQYKQNANFEQVISLAKGSKGNDDDGYRSEFIRLAESAKNMAKSSELSAVK